MHLDDRLNTSLRPPRMRPTLQDAPDHLEDLNDMQREAVTITEGAVLVVAGPGSGKTRVITHRVAYLVDRLDVNPYRILALTFTNKAAREMKSRLNSLIGDTRANEVSAGTFHSFCARLLRMHGSSIGLSSDFVIFDEADQNVIIKRALEDISSGEDYSPRVMLSYISRAKSHLLTPEGVSHNAQTYFDEVVARVYEVYQDLLTRNNAVDFDDLLMKTHDVLRDVPDVARLYQDRYRYVMIDEFQDTNLAQYSIARSLSESYGNICVVGDPDQSIYSWRNARVGNILEFQLDHPDTTLIQLEQNYRSTGNILRAAHSLIRQNEKRIDNVLWTSNPTGPKIVSGRLHDGMEEGQFVVNEVLDMTDPEEGEPEYSLSDIAVLYRTNAQSRPVEEACLQYGVPYEVIGGLKFYHRREVKDILAYLRLVLNAQDDVSFGRIVNVPPRGISKPTIDEISAVASMRSVSMMDAARIIATEGSVNLRPRAAKSVRQFCVLMDALSGARESKTLEELVRWMLVQTGYREWLQAKDEKAGEDRSDNLAELVDAISMFEQNSLEPEGDVLAAFLEQVSLISDVDQLEDSRETLTLITLHQAKGLEFPVVFIVGVNEGLLPHSRSISPEGDPDDQGDKLEEERRLCYVGITRAEERLYMLYSTDGYGRYRALLKGPSRFLDEIPQDVFTREPYLRS